MLTTTQKTKIFCELEKRKPDIANLLPETISVDKFIGTVKVAISNSPDIMACSTDSIINSCMSCAQDGLLPDKREAAIIVHKVSNKNTNSYEIKAQYYPMVAGILKLMWNSDDISNIVSELVYEKDEFYYSPLSDKHPRHLPNWFGNRGRIVGVYCVVFLKNGKTSVEIMSFDEIERIRRKSKTPDKGPWVTDWAEMARKTILKRIAKYLPRSNEKEAQRFFNAIDRIEEQYDETNFSEAEEAPKGQSEKKDIASSEIAQITAVKDESAVKYTFSTIDGEQIVFNSAEGFLSAIEIDMQNGIDILSIVRNKKGVEYIAKNEKFAERCDNILNGVIENVHQQDNIDG